MSTSQLASLNGLKRGRVQRGQSLKVTTTKRVKVYHDAEPTSGEGKQASASGDNDEGEDDNSEDEQIAEVKRVQQEAKQAETTKRAERAERERQQARRAEERNGLQEPSASLCIAQQARKDATHHIAHRQERRVVVAHCRQGRHQRDRVEEGQSQHQGRQTAHGSHPQGARQGRQASLSQSRKGQQQSVEWKKRTRHQSTCKKRHQEAQTPLKTPHRS